MPAWCIRRRLRLVAFTAGQLRRRRVRLYSTQNQNHERVDVSCGSAGSVSIDLYNINEHPQSSPIFIHLPSFPSSSQLSTPSRDLLPNFLRDKPVASINYRWSPDADDSDSDSGTSSLWPTPVHDTSFAYAWLAQAFAPPGFQRRDMYVYGSFLGASLATSLALTETHPHMPFAIRGGIAYNGVYNWTMFLPDHPINRPSKQRKATVSTSMGYLKATEGTHLGRMQERLSDLFASPAHLFDPFASPSLFFHNPGLAIPSTFHMSVAQAAAMQALMNPDEPNLSPAKTPRKSHMVFPPRQSTLKIPEMLLLYDSPVAATITSTSKGKSQTGIKRKLKVKGNTLESQAEELTELMQRSIEKVELKERSKWDDDVDSWDGEVERRVRMIEVGAESEGTELNELGERIVEDWLDERIDT